MSSYACRFAKLLRVSPLVGSNPSFVLGAQRSARLYSMGTSDSDNDEVGGVKNNYSTETFHSYNDEASGVKNNEVDDDVFLPEKPELKLHGVDPRRGWGFRGVHKAIICGKIGQAPVQKFLGNGRTVTNFTVGTGGMYDQRIEATKDLPRPAQWHRIAVHNEGLGAYAVQQLAKDSSVYVEGDIEVRVFNDRINGDIKSIPEICVRFDGKIRLIKPGESSSNLSLEELKEGLPQ